jgi:hypothetical protein
MDAWSSALTGQKLSPESRLTNELLVSEIFAIIPLGLLTVGQ